MSNTLFSASRLLVPLRSFFNGRGAATAAAPVVAVPAYGRLPARTPISWAGECQASRRPERTPRLRRSSAPLRVVRIVESGTTATLGGRLLISGRMADVCAELDRMVEREAALNLRA